MVEEKLSKLCSNLAYSQNEEFSNEIINSTIHELKKLWNWYGYAKVFGELSKSWNLPKAITFFNRIDLSINSSGKISTIATHYRRCYNGGIERVQAQLMNLWVQMGYKVVLFTEEPENDLDYAYPDSVKRILIPSPDKIVERLSILERACIEEKVDLYVNHNWDNSSVLWECMTLKMLHIPFIQYVHGHFAWNIWMNRNSLYQPELFKLCNLVLSLSETNARFYQLCGCKSYMVQNPIPKDLIENKDVSCLNSKHILMVGRLSIEKHPMDALRIFKIVHEKVPNAVLDIVGGDDYDFIPRISSYIEQNDLKRAVIIHGKKIQSEIAEFYKNSACVIFTSEMEGYPMVILESKAYGLPLIMYELPYLSLVKDGKGVVSVKQGDIDAMAKSIIKLLNNDEYRINLGKEARESFETFKAYDIESTWEKIITLCSTGEYSPNDLAYFNPDNVMYADKFIEPMLLDSIKKGYDYVVETNFYYKFGRKILQIPRKLKHVLLAMKGVLKHGEK